MKLPRDVSFYPAHTRMSCPASPVVADDFLGIAVNAPARLPATDATKMPLRGYVQLPFDYAGCRGEFPDHLTVVIHATAPFRVSLVSLAHTGSVVQSPDPLDDDSPDFVVGRYFNAELHHHVTVRPGRYFVYAFLGAQVSNVLTIDVEEES